MNQVSLWKVNVLIPKKRFKEFTNKKGLFAWYVYTETNRIGPKNELYSGFVNDEELTPENPYILASEALMFLLVGAQSHWKWPIGYFVSDKMSANVHRSTTSDVGAYKGNRSGFASVVSHSRWNISNLRTFRRLGCTFGTTYVTMITKFKHPTQDYFVHAIMGSVSCVKTCKKKLSTLSDDNGGKV